MRARAGRSAQRRTPIDHDKPLQRRQGDPTPTYRFDVHRVPWFALAAAALASAALSGCGSDNASTPDAPLACADLVGKTVAADKIGLPTGGATVTSASVVSATDAGNLNGDYCKVLGKITAAASDPAGTPDINFQLNLPAKWNGKALHMGGGGYNGTVVAGTGYVSFATYPFEAPPLGQGYATFGSDSGHAGNSTDASFALNEGAIVNFGYAHIKKTKDTAHALIKLRYAASPTKSYCAGASTGGREGMTAVQRFQNDYDGVIANAPAINFTGVRLQGVKIGQADYASGGYLFFQGDLYLSYFITKDPAFISFTYDAAANPGTYKQRLIDMSATVGAMNPDIEAFRARGGKLIVLHGLADQVISPNPTIAYYNAQVAKSGQAAIDAFWRLFAVPGYGHGYGVFNPAWDALGALDNWVVNGVAPDRLVAMDQNTATYGRTRPLCKYPAYPKFTGTGAASPNVYSNYTCANPS